MFNRTLQRPMFRIGGSAGTGITSGLDTPRKRYAFGSTGDQREYLENKNSVNSVNTDKSDRLRSEIEVLRSIQGDIPKREPYPYKASDFFMGLGSGILAQPGGQPIFQTIGKAAQGPIDQLSKTQMASWGQGQDDKIRQWKSDRDLLLTAYKNTSQEEKDKLWATAKGYHLNKGINPETGEPFKTPQEAYNLLLKEKFTMFRKDQSPEETEREDIIRKEKQLLKDIDTIQRQYDLGKPDAKKLSLFMEDVINNKYKLPAGGSGGAGRKWHIEPDDVATADTPGDKRLAIRNYDPDKEDYENGTIYLDFRSNIVYVKDGQFFIPYDDYMAETIEITEK
jgi:hypothetical protein